MDFPKVPHPLGQTLLSKKQGCADRHGRIFKEKRGCTDGLGRISRGAPIDWAVFLWENGGTQIDWAGFLEKTGGLQIGWADKARFL